MRTATTPVLAVLSFCVLELLLLTWHYHTSLWDPWDLHSSPPEPEPDSSALSALSENVTSRRAVPAGAVPVVIVSATWDVEPNTANETELLIKSLLYTAEPTCNLHFVLLADNSSETGLRQMLSTCRARARSANVTFTIRLLPVAYIARVIQFLGVPVLHHSGVGGYAKFLLPEILHDYNQILLLDTDILAGTNVCQLWDLRGDVFDKAADRLFAFPKSPGAFCSCVGLLHLRRMRAAGWNLTRKMLEETNDTDARTAANSTNTKTAGIDLKGVLVGHQNYGHGDQSMYIVVWRSRPSIFTKLPHSWNLEKCHDYYGTRPQRTLDHVPFVAKRVSRKGEKGLFFGFVHFNCVFGKPHGYSYTAKDLGPWGDVFDWFQNLDWADVGNFSLAEV